MNDQRVDEVMTPVAEADAPTEAAVPRRFAVQSIVGSLAGLAALGAGAAGAQERKKAAKKKTTKKKAAKKQTIGAQHAGQAGLLTRVRQVIDSVSVPSNSNRVLRLVCPAPRSGERVFVMGGGFTHDPFRRDFVIRSSAPDTTRSWVVDGHNVNTGVTVTLGGYAVCAYFRT